ncbi:MAG: DUF2281 domain-containing protein [Candidatus Electrothrix sp. AR1]|nr:DUF2281 domain-containing protein [Candidatus Electrothrix sp. AR1]
MAIEKREKAMMQQTGLHIGNHMLDLLKLPEAARQELLTFYEFLIFKYQAQADTGRSKKQRILSGIFKEARGVLPEQYTFDREKLRSIF